MFSKNEVEDFIKNYSAYLIIITIIYAFTTIIVLAAPKGFPIPELETSYNLFGPSLAALILLLLIGSYQIYRYFTKSPPQQNTPFQVIWGISFYIYAITMLGLCLEALAFEFADMTEPILFLVWRSPMIFWVAGMWLAITTLMTNDKRVQIIPMLLIIILGELWFFLGLIIVKDIELTMYGFLYWEFIPMALILALIWYHYGKTSTLSSPLVIASGFTLFGLVYLAWAPWHFSDVRYMWFIWFNVYLISLALIFGGLYAFPKEILAKFPENDEE